MHNGLSLLAAHLTLCLCLNLTTFLSIQFNLETNISTKTIFVLISILLISYSYIENFILQKYFIYIFTPWFLIIYNLLTNLTCNLNSSFKDLNINENMNLLICILPIFLFLLKLLMFVLYKTIRKHQLDKSQSHRILQRKQDKLIAFLKRNQQEKINQFNSFQYYKI
jgi:hypothetical protein